MSSFSPGRPFSGISRTGYAWLVENLGWTLELSGGKLNAVVEFLLEAILWMEPLLESEAFNTLELRLIIESELELGSVGPLPVRIKGGWYPPSSLSRVEVASVERCNKESVLSRSGVLPCSWKLVYRSISLK